MVASKPLSEILLYLKGDYCNFLCTVSQTLVSTIIRFR